MGDLTVHVVCSTLCFGRRPIGDALRRIRALDFSMADLVIGPQGPHWTPQEVAAHLPRCQHLLKAANVPLAAIHVDVGEVDPTEARLQFQAVACLARTTLTPLLTIPTAPYGADIQAELDRLRDYYRMAAAEGLLLAIQTHREQLTADPETALFFCRRIHGLGIALDPSHYLIGPHGKTSYDALYPYVLHVRLRDTGTTPEQFQVQVGQGEIEYSRIINQLEHHHYQRALSIDIHDIPEFPYAIDVEVRKLKYLLESLV
jgi:sugar phosphate isomerase/epimerase